MNDKVFCIKLHRELDKLPEAPLPGELGIKVWDNVSRDGWKLFLDWFRMIVNEQHLDLTNPNTDRIFLESLDYFFFREQAANEKPGHKVLATTLLSAQPQSSTLGNVTGN